MKNPARKLPVRMSAGRQGASPQQVIRCAAMLGGTLTAFIGCRRGGLLGSLLAGIGIAIFSDSAKQHAVTARKASLAGRQNRTVHLESSVNINRPPEDVYAFWKDFVRLPEVMSFVDDIKATDTGYTHWVAKGPLGTSVEWFSEVVEDEPGKRLIWRSLNGSDIDNWGNVAFHQDAGSGTNLIVNLNFEPLGGVAGSAVGHFLEGIENSVLTENLLQLKTYLETGEIPTSQS
ncbi:SRPBCC family protein [Marinobacter fonticola]|uniref:SRPBCC family protein n=1 Tax=Marinobacter fonticola TaxID=2603215 RepID=UPI0011E76E70|nr:SRPBCC family protein [Marinobacter fonticola]